MTEPTTLADENEWARVCLYGRYGTGKTTAMAAAARLGIVVHVDAEQRLKAGPLRRPPLSIPVNRIEPHREIGYESLKDLIWRTKERLHDEPGSIAAFGIDSMTETVKLMIGQIIDSFYSDSVARAARRGEDVNLNPFEVPENGWNEMTEQMRRLFRLMRDLECHLVFTAHERRDIDEADQTVSYGPAVTPAVQQDLMGYVDILGHTEMDNGVYIARFAPGSKYQAKDTFGVLPKVMADPTLDRIVAYVREELTIDTDPVQLAYRQMVLDRQEVAKHAAAAQVTGTRAPRRRRGEATA